MRAGRLIATLNTGSSSLKFAVYAPQAGEPGTPRLRGQISGLPDTPRLSFSAAETATAEAFRGALDLSDLSPPVLAPNLIATMEKALGRRLHAAGHRIVQGGPDLSESVRATPEQIARLARLSPLAPDHQPHNLSAVEALAGARPELIQTLSFDTAFHRSQPRLAQLYALPRRLTEEGVIRYGYHGLSYAHIARRLASLFAGRPCRHVLACHLGSGSSLCAIQDGKSLACSMGFSAMSGIPMATRCGDIDPGALLYLIQERGYSAEAVSRLLRLESGLLGVSGISADLREIAASLTSEAREAIDLYIYRIVREAGSLIAALGGLDAIIFTGGIGENSPEVRSGIVSGLSMFGASIDPAANDGGAEDLTAATSRIAIAVIPADEEDEIARGCLAHLGRSKASTPH
jgi:acetate kinase